MSDQTKTVEARDSEGGIYDIPLDMVDQAIKKGLSVASQTVEMYDDKGDVYDVPVEHYSKAIGGGFKAEKPKTTLESISDGLDTFNNASEALLQKARPFATFGGSYLVNAAEEALSSPERNAERTAYRKKLEQDHPILSATGDTVGIMANPLARAGVASAGNLASAGASGISKVALTGAGEGIAGGVMARTVTPEGIDIENALDIGAMGGDAALGGLANTALTGVAAIPKVYRAAKDKVLDLYGTGMAKLSNIPKEDIAAYKANPDVIDSVNPTEEYRTVQKHVDSITGKVDDAAKEVQDAQKVVDADQVNLRADWKREPVPENVPQQVSDAFEALESKIKDIDANSTALIEPVQTPVNIQPIKDEIGTLGSSADIHGFSMVDEKGFGRVDADGNAIVNPVNAATELANKVRNINAQIDNVDLMTPNQLIGLRRHIDDMTTFANSMGVQDSAFSARLLRIRGKINDTIEASLPKQAGAQWRANNAEISRLAEIQGKASKSFGKAGSNAIASTFSNPDKRAVLQTLGDETGVPTTSSLDDYYKTKTLAQGGPERNAVFENLPSQKNLERLQEQHTAVKQSADDMTAGIKDLGGIEQQVDMYGASRNTPHRNVGIVDKFKAIAEEVNDPTLMSRLDNVGTYNAFNPKAGDAVNKSIGATAIETTGLGSMTKAGLRAANRIAGIDTRGAAKWAFRKRFNIPDSVPDNVIDPVVERLIQGGPIAAAAAHNSLMAHNNTYKDAVEPPKAESQPKKSKAVQLIESGQGASLGKHQKALEDAYQRSGAAGVASNVFVLSQQDEELRKLLNEENK
jgi:hypothetical protein